MAKRTRGSARPAQRRPATRTPARPAPTRPVVRPAEGLSDEEEARAAELEARLVAQERAAEQTRTRTRERSRYDAEDRVARRAAGQSLLAVKAQEEYAYVARDVRRIVTVAGGLLGIMAVLFVLIQVLHVITVG